MLSVVPLSDRLECLYCASLCKNARSVTCIELAGRFTDFYGWLEPYL